ncbi:MAG: chromosome segregation protein SMC [Pseudooceanicola sp.]|nr:chromosome segregation protein SMC [Pseudooceanicola sp.]
MKLRAITLENVRRFTSAVRIEGLADGVNVLCEPNEHGKSTLFDALQAVFFKPHRSQDGDVKRLRPHAGGAPEVTVEVETSEGRFTIAKRWLSRPMATVHQGGRLVAQADAAEDWIARQVGGGDGGPSGLVWVRQGLTGLDGAGKKEQETGLAARRDLMSSVTGEVEAMTGGRRMDAALARCRGELGAYATGTGKPRANGPWAVALADVERLTAERETLARTAEDLHAALKGRMGLRRDLSELDTPEAAEARRKRVEVASAAFEVARRHAEAAEAAAQKVDTARAAVASAQARLDRAQADLDERRLADEAAKASAEAARVTAEAQKAAQGALEAAQGALVKAEAEQKDKAEVLRRVRVAQRAREGAERRAELVARIAQAEAARAAVEAAEAAAMVGPDAAMLRRLDELAARRDAARAMRDAAAAQVVVRYREGAGGRVLRDGAAVEDGVALPVTAAVTLDLEGIGRMELRPGAGAADHAPDAAERALAEALDKAEAASLDAAREAGARRVQAERDRAEAGALFKALAPEGIARLRELLAAIPEAMEDADLPDPESAEAAMRAAEVALDTARVRREMAAKAESDARSANAKAGAEAAAATGRLTRAEAALERTGGAEALEDLSNALTRAVTALTADEARQAETNRTAPDLAGAEAALKRAQSVAQAAQSDINRMNTELATLTERISRSSGEAVEERLAETVEKLAAAEAHLERIEHEVAVLQRLEAALESARGAARDRYFEPVARELAPLLHLLWPDAALTWGQDTLLPTSLARDGQDEAIDLLSGGTQEQIALLVRLAFARMLAADGRHAPVILDDALVFTDDDRIEVMFNALHRQAGDLQIIVLTCRQRAFRELGGQRLRLETVPA